MLSFSWKKGDLVPNRTCEDAVISHNDDITVFTQTAELNEAPRDHIFFEHREQVALFRVVADDVLVLQVILLAIHLSGERPYTCGVFSPLGRRRLELLIVIGFLRRMGLRLWL